MPWVLGAVALSVSVAGCGLTMTRGPDANRRQDERPSCTETMKAPKQDSIGAVLGLVTVLAGAIFIKAGDNETVGVPLIIGGVAVTVASYVSGGVGYFRVKNCRKAIAEFEHRTTNAPAPVASPAN